MSVPSGSINLNCQLSVQVPAAGNNLSAYTVPVSPSSQAAYAAGTAANQVNKVATVGGSAAASPVSIDLTSVVCVDGSTGFAHVRELIIFNDDTNDPHVLKLDMTVSNAFTNGYDTITAGKIDIAAGEAFRRSKPIGTNGWVVDSTHKIVDIDPGANTVPYRVVIAGD
jgi:hypothetical protein